MFICAVILGSFFILMGIFFNPKIVSIYFSSHGTISPYYQRLIYVYDVVFFIIGIAILASLYGLVKKNGDKRAAGKRVLGKFFLLFAEIVVMLVVFEIIFRLPMVKKITGGNSPEIIKINASEVKLNNFGFRDIDRKIDKDPGTFRIAAVGDSFTFGQGVKFNDTFPHRLEISLNSDQTKNAFLRYCGSSVKCVKTIPKKFEVWNFGESGYSTADELAILKDRVLAYNPDLILIGFCLNDPDPGDSQPSPYQYPPAYGLVLPFGLEHQLEMHSYFYSFVKDRWNRILEKYHFKQSYEEWQNLLYNPKWNPWLKERAVFKELADISKSKKIKIVTTILASMTNFKNYPYEGAHQLVGKTAKEFGFEVVDTLPAFRGEDADKLKVSVSDGHPNGAADKIYEDEIFKFMTANWSRLRY